ncbi:MAG: chemotaxis response regulator protein-glutamate methylesterase [Firmicutes bacterium]|nr:chemotaxis response regulator protein-glutamate methylesterase [Bacillota bacterium]
MGKIRVLVADDSAFMRKVISKMVASDPDMEVVATARDGGDALEKIKVLLPDVVTLDVQMPKVDGLTALKRIMSEVPTPVVMLSSLTQENAETTMEALRLGAVDFVPKPSGTISLDIEKVRDQLLTKIRIARRAKLFPHRMRHFPQTRVPLLKKDAEVGLSALPGSPGGAPGAGMVATPGNPPENLVIIGSSTGGPGALQEIVPRLPGDLDAGVLVVQHMPPGFTRSLAMRLDEISLMDIKEGEDGEPISRGKVIVAPGGLHMVVTPDKTIALNGGPPLHGVRPAIDITLESALPVFGRRIVGVILTGMGMDGARGMAMLKKSGGRTIVQDEETSVVYGMPRAVVEMGNADRVVSLDHVADAIAEAVDGI